MARAPRCGARVSCRSAGWWRRWQCAEGRVPALRGGRVECGCSTVGLRALRQSDSVGRREPPPSPRTGAASLTDRSRRSGGEGGGGRVGRHGARGSSVTGGVVVAVDCLHLVFPWRSSCARAASGRLPLGAWTACLSRSLAPRACAPLSHLTALAEAVGWAPLAWGRVLLLTRFVGCLGTSGRVARRGSGLWRPLPSRPPPPPPRHSHDASATTTGLPLRRRSSPRHVPPGGGSPHP